MPDYTAGKARILLEPTARNFYSNSRREIKAAVGAKGLQAEVYLQANTNGFHAQANRDLARKELRAKVDLTPRLAPGFRSKTKELVERELALMKGEVHVMAQLDLTRATAQMKLWRAAQEAKPLNIKVTTNRPNVTTRAAASAATGAAPSLPTGVNTSGLQQQVSQAVQGINKNPANKVTIRTVMANRSEAEQDLRHQVRQLQHDLDNNFRLRIQPTIAGVQLRLPLGALGTQVIPGAVAAIGTLVAAIQELSGTALILPGAMAAAGASIGTFAIGISGISDAWKALSDEQDRAAEQATTDAARMETANAQVKNSTLDITDAQKDLNDARKAAKRDLEDLHNAERANSLSVAEAALQLQKANNELRKPAAGAFDRNEKVLNQAEAQQNLNDALLRQKRGREDVNEADKKGIEGSDQVQNATRRLADSVDALAKAQRNLAMESSGAANAHDKAQAAMAKLGPEAAKLTQLIFDNKSKFMDLRTVVSNNMFHNLSNEIDLLIKTDFPLLERGLGSIGTAWNGTLTTLSRNLRSTGTQDILSRIFGNTAEAQQVFNRAIDPIIRGLGTLAAAGTDALPRLSFALGDVATRLANFIGQADDDGRLQHWIDQGIDAFGSLSRTIGNVLSIVNGVSRAFGGTFLSTIESVTKKIGDFLNSAQGQQDLITFIAEIRGDIEAWKPILEDLPAVFATAMDAGRSAIQAALPFFNLLTELLEHAPWLVQAVVTAFLGWSVIRPALTATTALVQGVTNALTDVGTGFAMTKAKAAEGAQGINDAFDKAGRNGSGIAKLSGRMSTFATFMGAAGPWGLAIAAAGGALFALAQDHDFAADAAEAHKRAEDRLADSLDRVSGAAGAATRATLSREMEDFSDPDRRMLRGNVRQAVQDVGLNPADFITSTLPGGEKTADAERATLREKVKPTVVQALKDAGAESLDADLVTDAFLGVPGKVEEFKAALAKKNEARTAMRLSPLDIDLGDIAGAVGNAGGQANAAALASQFLNLRQPQIAAVQGRAQSANRSATGLNPTLKPAAAAMFGGSKVDVASNGDQTTLTITNLKPETAALLKARNDQVSAPTPGPGGPVTVVTLTQADTQALVDGVPSFGAGGPTPGGKGNGPTGGTISEVHPDEWVLPRHARKALGDEFLWSITKNRGMPRRNGMDIGGPGDIAPPVNHIKMPWETGYQAPAGTPNVGDPGSPGPGNDAGVPDPSSPGAPMPANPMLEAVKTMFGFGDPTTGLNSLAGQSADPSTGGVASSPTAGLNIGGKMFGGNDTAPDEWLGNFGANVITSFGSALISGVLGFFGVSADNAYVNAFKQTVGFYTGKSGGGADQTVDPATQALIDANLDPTTGLPITGDGSGSTPVSSISGLVSSAIVGDKYVGSGVIAPPNAAIGAKQDASRAPSAQVIGDANIVDYLRSQALAQGLTVGAEAQENSPSRYRNENGSLHEIGRAVDIFGTPEQRRAFLLKWESDPRLTAATRMIIDDNNTDLEAYGGKTRAEGAQVTYSRGDHPDHIHLGLEGVPGYLDPTTGQIMAVGVGGGPAPAGAGTLPAGVDPNAQTLRLGGRPDDGGGGTNLAKKWFGVDTPQSSSTGKTGLGYAGTPYSTGGGSTGSTGAIPPLPFQTSPSSGSGGKPAGDGKPRFATATPGGNPKYRSEGGVRPSRAGAGPGQASASGTGITDQYGNLEGGGGGKGALLNLQMAAARKRNGGLMKAPGGNYSGGSPTVYDPVYTAFLAAGFPPDQWGDLVNIVNKESSWNIDARNPNGGAFGLFQFLGGTKKAYLPDESTDPLVQGQAGMKYIRDRYGSPAAAWAFWQKHSWYDRGNGLLPRGVTVTHNDTNQDEVVIGKKQAEQAREIIRGAQDDQAHQMTPGPSKTMAPKPPITADIPSVLPGGPSAPAPGISAAAEPQAPIQSVAPAPGAQGGGVDHLLPAIATGIKSGASTIGSIAQTAAAAATFGATGGMGGGGMGGGGPSIQGAVMQAGKIVEGIANVGAAFASGFTNFGGTTPNPYGVQLKSTEKAPPLASDNRRIQYGDNNYASLDEWRRQTQLQDRQDMQADMARL